MQRQKNMFLFYSYFDVLSLGTTSSSNLIKSHERSQILANIVMIAALVTGFLIIIICIVAASLLTRRHFSHIILRSEKNISSVLMGPSMNMDRFLSRELERWDSSVPQLSRYEHISVVQFLVLFKSSSFETCPFATGFLILLRLRPSVPQTLVSIGKKLYFLRITSLMYFICRSNHFVIIY